MTQCSSIQALSSSSNSQSLWCTKKLLRLQNCIWEVRLLWSTPVLQMWLGMQRCLSKKLTWKMACNNHEYEILTMSFPHRTANEWQLLAGSLHSSMFSCSKVCLQSNPSGFLPCCHHTATLGSLWKILLHLTAPKRAEFDAIGQVSSVSFLKCLANFS